MKITGFELFKVPPRWLFLKVSTDAGIAGWGEPVVEGRADTVRAAVEELSHYLIGRDPFRIEDTFQVLYRGGFYRGGPVLTSALSGIEQALWDIKGRALGVPVYELLGGKCRDRVRVYVHAHGATPGALAEDAAARLERYGCTAVKVAPQPPESDRLPFAAVVRRICARSSPSAPIRPVPNFSAV